MMRVVAPLVTDGRPELLICTLPGCGNTTRGGKPFCVRHVAEHPYVQDVLDQLTRLETELAKVRKIGTRGVNPSGLMVQEILRELHVHGPRTVTRLARDLGVDAAVLASYVAVLTKRGSVRQTQGDRRRIYLHLVHGAPVRSVA